MWDIKTKAYKNHTSGHHNHTALSTHSCQPPAATATRAPNMSTVQWRFSCYIHLIARASYESPYIPVHSPLNCVANFSWSLWVTPFIYFSEWQSCQLVGRIHSLSSLLHVLRPTRKLSDQCLWNFFYSCSFSRSLMFFCSFLTWSFDLYSRFCYDGIFIPFLIVHIGAITNLALSVLDVKCSI